MGRQGLRLYVGARFGRGLVMAYWTHYGSVRKVQMVCDCGKIYHTYSPALYSGQCNSCGCLHLERITKHGYERDHRLLWARYRMMLARCYDPKHPNFSTYGGRGITVCDRWRESFDNFLADMGEPEKGMTLERIYNDGPYCKENCKWATRTEQGRNKRNNRRHLFQGALRTLSEISELVGIKASTLKSRITTQKMTIEEAAYAPVRPWGRGKKKEEVP